MLMTTWPYCPRPPDCLTNLPSTFSDRLRIGLARLFVRVDTERRILVRQFDEPTCEFVRVDPGLRFDRDRDHGLREIHRLENDRVVRMADRVARLDVLETDDRRDITRKDLVSLLTLVRVHLEESSNSFLLIFCRI